MSLLVKSQREKTNPLRRHSESEEEEAQKKNPCCLKAPGIWGKATSRKWNFTLDCSCKTEDYIIAKPIRRTKQSIKAFSRVAITKLLRSRTASRGYSKSKFSCQ